MMSLALLANVSFQKDTVQHTLVALGHDARKCPKIEGAYYLRNCYKLFKESFKAREEDKTALSSKAMHNNIPYNRVKHISRGVGYARH